MSRQRRVLLLAVAVLLGVLTFAGQASAHATLQESRPGNDEVLEAPPTEVSLRFDEPVVVVGAGLRVFGPDGSRVDTGRPRVDGLTVAVGVDADPRGTYTVAWRVLSEDSHNLSGSFVFHVGVKTGAVRVDEGQSPVMSFAGGAGRFLAFAGALLLIGAAAVHLLRPGAVVVRRLGPLILLASVAGLVGALAIVLFQAARATGSTTPSWSEITDLARNTRTGQLTLVRCALFAAVALTSQVTRLRVGHLVAGVGLAAVTAAAGHPWTSSSRPVALVADVAHQVFVGSWLGGVVALLVSVRLLVDRTALVQRFSTLSLFTAAGTLLTGVVSGFLNVRELSGLTGTGYGQLLILKTVGFTVLCGFGWLNRNRYLPALERALNAFVRSLWRSTALGAVVLVLTAALVNQPPAVTTLRKPVEVRVVVDGALMQLVVSPARVGLNDLHMYFFDSDGGGGFSVDAVEITAATGDLPPRRLQVTPVTSSHQSAYGASLTTPGDWTFTVTALSEGTKTVFTAQVPIR